MIEPTPRLYCMSCEKVYDTIILPILFFRLDYLHYSKKANPAAVVHLVVKLVWFCRC